MPLKLDIPNDAVPYILFQRTSYLKLVHSLPYRILQKLSPFPLYQRSVNIESALRRMSIKNNYEEDMRNEYSCIKRYLPERCDAILDIGCGVAGIDAFLNLHYASEINFYLLDKSIIQKDIYYQYNEYAAFYNSLDIAKTMLATNGVQTENIHLTEATELNDINIDRCVDLIISLLSWGFHDPISAYINQAYEKLNPGGSLILDMQRGNNAKTELQSKFDRIEIIEENKSPRRILAIKVN